VRLIHRTAMKYMTQTQFMISLYAFMALILGFIFYKIISLPVNGYDSTFAIVYDRRYILKQLMPRGFVKDFFSYAGAAFWRRSAK
jgi:hypothetical protein